MSDLDEQPEPDLAAAPGADADGASCPEPGAADGVDPEPGRDEGEEQQEAEPGDDAPSPLAFDPVRLRFRHDGWLPERQEDFIRALAESGCVEEAARRVGMSASSAYELRARPEAQSFRFAWEAALDMAMPRMSDAAISRCIYGVPVPHYYKGDQVGEHRRFDERLTMWMLRYRDPVNYGKWNDRVSYRRAPDGAARTLLHRLWELFEDSIGKLKRRRSAVGPLDVEEDMPR